MILFFKVEDDGRISACSNLPEVGYMYINSEMGYGLLDGRRPYYFDIITRVVTHPPQIITFGDVRAERNVLLIESDWRMVIDYPGTDQSAWATYRQALRDIPQDYPEVSDIVWPTKPI